MLWEQLLVLGLIAGAVYSLVGIGFTLVLGVGRIANFAHGAFVGVGLYFAYFMNQHLGWSPYLSLVPAVPLFLLLGWISAELFEWRGRKVGEVGELLVGLAMLLLITGLLETIYTDKPRAIQGVTAGQVVVAGLKIQGTQIIAAALAFSLAGGFYVLMKTSRWGRALRAVAENPVAAGLHGVRVPLAQRVAVVVSILMAGVAGVIISPFTILTPSAGTTYLIAAFAVVVIGGIGNTLGAVAAGLAIGVVDSFASGYLASYWTTLAPLILILVFLLVRPETEVAV